MSGYPPPRAAVAQRTRTTNACERLSNAARGALPGTVNHWPTCFVRDDTLTFTRVLQTPGRWAHRLCGKQVPNTPKKTTAPHAGLSESRKHKPHPSEKGSMAPRKKTRGPRSPWPVPAVGSETGRCRETRGLPLCHLPSGRGRWAHTATRDASQGHLVSDLGVRPTAAASRDLGAPGRRIRR